MTKGHIKDYKLGYAMNNIYIIYYILISLDIINEVFIAKVTSYEDSRVGFSFVVQTV